MRRAKLKRDLLRCATLGKPLAPAVAARGAEGALGAVGAAMPGVRSQISPTIRRSACIAVGETSEKCSQWENTKPVEDDQVFAA